jgi:hypothetical protein
MATPAAFVVVVTQMQVTLQSLWLYFVVSQTKSTLNNFKIKALEIS